MFAKSLHSAHDGGSKQNTGDNFGDDGRLLNKKVDMGQLERVGTRKVRFGGGHAEAKDLWSVF